MTEIINDIQISDDLSLVQYNKKKHFDLIENFNCSNNVFNRLLKELPSHHCCAKMLVKQDRILAYCAYRCSSIKIENEVFPAIEIRAFARDKNYCKKSNDNTKSIARIFFEMVLSKLNDIANNVIGAKYICLHSIDSEKLIKMYQDIGFETQNNIEELNDKFNDKCVPMFMLISK